MSKRIRKITFPHMGHYDAAFEEIMRAMGHIPVMPDPINRATVETGVKYAPEFICFPCKVNIGDELNGIAKGADTVVMFSSNGQCRYRYYAAVQRKILHDLGQKIDFFIFTPRDWLKKFSELTNRNYFSLLLRFVSAWRKVKTTELVEQLGYYYRPRALHPERVGGIQQRCWKLISQTKLKSYFNYRRLKRQIREEFEEIEIKDNFQPLRIGIIGEIYSVIEPFVNQNIEESLGNLGVEVTRRLNLSHFVKEFQPWNKRYEARLTRPYIGYVVGGHGRTSVLHLLEYCRENFDGVIHLAVFGCMPEVTVRPILSKISQQKNMPFISLSLDEHSGQAGVQTRVEAFVDLIKGKIRNPKSEIRNNT